MAWWIYKCNSKQRDYQVAYGEWSEFFDGNRTSRWGSTEYGPTLAKLTPGDLIIAYQTDRNELVGICRMVRFKKEGEHQIVYLEPLTRIGVKVRPLKEANRSVAAIPALQGGPIMTLYHISEEDAKVLLAAAGATVLVEPEGEALEEQFLEGEKRAVVTTARNSKLRAAAKKFWGLKCYCCGFDFQDFYGSLAIVHHFEPFADTNGNRRRATVDDVRVVCANCHYVVHVQNPPIDVDVLKRLISRDWTRWSRRGVLTRNRALKK